MPEELKRTCNKCGTVWYVQPKELKGPSFGELFEKGVGIGKTRKRSQAIRELRRTSDARVADLGRCPSCRSTDFR